MTFAAKMRAQKFLFVGILMAIPALVVAQHKTNSAPAAPHASAPAPHASAPAHNSAPAAQHSNAPARNNMGTPNRGNSTMNRPNNGTGARPNNTNSNMGHNTNSNVGHGNTMNRPNTTNGRNNTGNTAGGRPNNAAAGHGNTMAGGHNAATNRTPPGRQVSLRGGGSASIRPNGQIRSVNRNGMQINRGMHGGRTVVSTHNGARVVTTGRHGGYVQRAYFSRGGRTYVSRTYVVNNVTYTGVYRSYGYGGYCCYYGYAPAYYWHPAYYGWAYNPWPAPVYYGWGWGGAPWYGYYGPYYAPYPAYPSAAFWLTDWMIAASLQAAYAAQVEANAMLNPLGPDYPLVASLGGFTVPEESKVVLSKEVKDQLAEEIKAQIADDQAEAQKGKSSGDQASASGGTLPAIDPKRRIFVVHDELDPTVDGEECSLTDGDIISRTSDTPDSDKNVTAKVLASKKGDCAIGKEIAVSLDDLQEMHNHFREQMSSGMDELSKKQGTGGLPKAPDTGKQDGEVPAPPADSNAAKTLKEQQSAADQTEADVKQEAGSSGGGAQ